MKLKQHLTAVKAQQLLSNSFLPLRPINEYDCVLTVFWVDNFDIKVGKQTGSTFVNATRMIAFQERREIVFKKIKEHHSLDHENERLKMKPVRIKREKFLSVPK